MDGRNYSFLIKYDSYTLLPYAPSLKKKKSKIDDDAVH
jgi:hypothetical protein